MYLIFASPDGDCVDFITPYGQSVEMESMFALRPSLPVQKTHRVCDNNPSADRAVDATLGETTR